MKRVVVLLSHTVVCGQFSCMWLSLQPILHLVTNLRQWHASKQAGKAKTKEEMPKAYDEKESARRLTHWASGSVDHLLIQGPGHDLVRWSTCTYRKCWFCQTVIKVLDAFHQKSKIQNSFFQSQNLEVNNIFSSLFFFLLNSKKALSSVYGKAKARWTSPKPDDNQAPLRY